MCCLFFFFLTGLFCFRVLVSSVFIHARFSVFSLGDVFSRLSGPPPPESALGHGGHGGTPSVLCSLEHELMLSRDSQVACQCYQYFDAVSGLGSLVMWFLGWRAPGL